MGGSLRRTRIAAVVFVIGLTVSACQSDGIDGVSHGPGTGRGLMGISSAASPPQASMHVPETYPCRPATGNEDYGRYGPGRMRRGGLEPEELERNHIVIDGEGVNFHGIGRVVDGEKIEMEMDDDYFEPTVLKGPAGGSVTIELRNEGLHPHNFSVPGQGIDLNCGVRAHGEVKVAFPRSGVLIFTCKYTATSGMRGALAVKEPAARR
jgi:plastocyanin